VARLCTCFGHLYSDGGDPAAGLPWYDRAVDGLAAVLKQQPNEASTRQALRRAHAGRARALGKLGRHADAVQAWDQALKADASPANAEIRLYRAAALARAGDPATAAAEVEALAANAKAPVLVGMAHVHAIIAAVDPGSADRSATRAVALLRQAAAAGHIDFALTLADKDFHPLRGRADFGTFLWDLADMPVTPPKR
jgi:tetratricopeptide (TPR) repeat protein